MNELDDATAFAEWVKLPNFQTKVSAEEFDIVPTEQYHMDEPLGAPSAIPLLFFVSKLAREQVKVAAVGRGLPTSCSAATDLPRPSLEFDKYFKVPRLYIDAAPRARWPRSCRPSTGCFHMRLGAAEKSYQREHELHVGRDSNAERLRRLSASREWCKPHFDEAAKQNLDIITQTQYVDTVSYMPFGTSA